MPAGGQAARAQSREIRSILSAHGAEGSETLQMSAPAQSAEIRQAVTEQSASSTGEIRRAAAAGVNSAGGELPFAERIQAAFGKHDISDIRAHVGGTATEACSEIGARAYASGTDVAFTSSPGLEIAAHEAAHVVQQRAGVSLTDGLGRSGDAYEHHADAVAAAVVSGRSAEGILDQVAGQTTAGSATAVQRHELQQMAVQFWPPNLSNHFEQRAAQRGVTEAEADEAYQNGTQYSDPDYPGGTVYYDSASGAAICQVSNGTFTTCYKQARPKSRWVPK